MILIFGKTIRLLMFLIFDSLMFPKILPRFIASIILLIQCLGNGIFVIRNWISLDEENLIIGIPLSHSNMNDKLIWNLDKKGFFYVK